LQTLNFGAKIKLIALKNASELVTRLARFCKPCLAYARTNIFAFSEQCAGPLLKISASQLGFFPSLLNQDGEKTNRDGENTL